MVFDTRKSKTKKMCVENRLNCTLACFVHLPNAWHCKIFVRPSLTIEPDDDGCVVNLGG